jgi:glycosyltransferase involved in cell wall biosynthesis
VVKAVAFAVPGDLNTPTGGYTYDRRIVGELEVLGWQVEVLDIGDGFPRPTPEVRTIAGAQLMGLPVGQLIVIDGLAYAAIPEEAQSLRERYPLVALVHHPLALETGLGDAEAAALRESERAALACARHVIVTSAATGRLLIADYGVPAERLTVVQPGTDRAAAHEPRRSNETLTLLTVGAIVPRKGYDVLIEALARLKDHPWRLVIVGDNTRSPETAARLDEDIARYGLSDRIEIAGPVSEKRLAELYAAADLFVLPSRFEGYGMAYTEAVARGVPVVGTNAGAIPDTVPPGAGILVPPDDVEALAATLRRLIDNEPEREQLAAGARAASTSFPTWRESAVLFASVLDGLA